MLRSPLFFLFSLMSFRIVFVPFFFFFPNKDAILFSESFFFFFAMFLFASVAIARDQKGGHTPRPKKWTAAVGRRRPSPSASFLGKTSAVLSMRTGSKHAQTWTRENASSARLAQGAAAKKKQKKKD